MKGTHTTTPRQTGKRNPSCATVAIAALAIGLTAAADRAVFGQCNYELTSIIAAADCDIGPSVTFARGLNIHGHVTGYYRPCAIGNERAFFWSQETGFVTLPTPPDVYRAWAYDISDTGLIVGQHGFAGVGSKGFIYDMNKNNGEYTYLEPVHAGVVAQNLSSANAVNSKGVVAGMRVYTKPGVTPARYNAVIWRPLENGSPVEDLGVMGVGSNSNALNISEYDEAVGWTGNASPAIGFFRDKTGDIVVIDPADGADTSNASAVNMHGYVIGTTVTVSVPTSRAYLWHRDEGMMTIDPVAGFTSSQGSDINSVGQVLMRSSTSAANIIPTLWQHGKQVKLQDLLVPDPSVTLGPPRGITDSGQILVRVENSRGGLLTPVDVPFGDLNYDCRVDVHDLLLMFHQWGPVPANIGRGHGLNGVPTADINGDGVVDVTDLLILFDHWSP